MKLKWFFKLPDYVQHSLIAALAMLIVASATQNVTAGAMFGIALYYGREIRDSENANPALYDNIKVLWPGYWTKDSLTDFIAPMITCLVMLAAFKFIF